MTFGLYVIWVVQTIAAYAILFLIQLPMRRHAGWILRAVVFGFFAVIGKREVLGVNVRELHGSGSAKGNSLVGGAI